MLWNLPAYPDRYAARLVTSGRTPSAYLLLADSLAGVQGQLPPGLVRSERMPVDPPEVVEIWFAGQGMSNQRPLPFPGAEERCPKCQGKGDVYYLHAKMAHVDVVGGKRVVCPAYEGAGMITVPMQHKVVVT